MFEKKIKSYTIVPSSLYVLRDADRQIRQIISDMGRPGYVLVSRQTGKTNLLLNTKRDMDQTENCFTYVDISNTFEDLRSFFRNLIDTIIDGSSPSFSLNDIDLASSRLKSVNLQPHKEHELELRLILSKLPKKLIICLDEIDALTKVAYADQVFSLIRSIYFSGRTNFQEFSRLTYVLSGVADPADLIKNKAISPFNIGEKIYLNDFSISETNQLLKNSSIDLPQDIVQRIYDWASGNPRMTWDICSAIENILISGEQTTTDTVDRVVQDIYLKNFDLPPIDHIRTRVELDKEIRSSVMQIHYNKGGLLPDKVKDKLYLAGIATSKAADGSISFKNKIMAEALSEKWLTELERQKLTLDERANERMIEEKYSEAAALYEEFLSSSETPDKSLAFLRLGYCQMMLGDLDTAIVTFSKAAVEKNLALYFFQAHWRGVCHQRLKQFDKAIANLKAITDAPESDERNSFYFQACVNLSIAYFESTKAEEITCDVSASRKEYVKLLEQVTSSEQEMLRLLGSTSAKRILYTAYYQQHLYKLSSGEVVDAIECLIQAAQKADDSSKITIWLERAVLEVEPANRKKLLEQSAKEIIETCTSLKATTLIHPLMFNEENCSSLIYQLVKNNLIEMAIDVIYHFDKQEGSYSGWSLLMGATLIALKENNYDSLFDLTKIRIYNKFSGTPVGDARHGIGLAMAINTERDSRDLTEKFKTELLESPEYILETNDLRVIYEIVFDLINIKDYAASNKVLGLAERGLEAAIQKGELSTADLSTIKTLLKYLNLKAYEISDNPFLFMQQAILVRDELLQQENSILWFPKGFMSDLARALSNQLSSASTAPLRRELKIGRNEIVTVKLGGGQLVTGKYKKFISIIQSGKGVIVSAD